MNHVVALLTFSGPEVLAVSVEGSWDFIWSDRSIQLDDRELLLGAARHTLGNVVFAGFGVPVYTGVYTKITYMGPRTWLMTAVLIDRIGCLPDPLPDNVAWVDISDVAGSYGVRLAEHIGLARYSIPPSADRKVY